MAHVRIRLIVTGEMERLALASSMCARFPATDVNNAAVEWLPAQKAMGATSHRLRVGGQPTEVMRRLAKTALAELRSGQGGVPADLVVVVDDLELHNFDQPQLVCEQFRTAISEEAARLDQVRRPMGVGQQPLREIIRERSSFHLLSPMVESYFFGDRAVLQKLGCSGAEMRHMRSTDWEDFWTTDPDYAPRCAQKNQEMHAPPLNHHWWQQERHAKHYLEHLITVNAGGSAFYEESTNGAAALRQLDWPNVPRQTAECPFIRALFSDIADFLGVPSPLGSGGESPLTYRGPKFKGARTLRNL